MLMFIHKPMKTKTKSKLVKLEHEIGVVLATPLHLRVEYFLRKRYLVLAMMTLMCAAMAKSDGKFLGIMREAYSHGYGKVGTYLRNETVHRAHTTTHARVIVAASQ